MDKKILIAEDELIIATLWKDVIQLKGHRVKLARNGEEATDMLKIESFDLLITDLRMPKIDGYGLIDFIEKSKVELPIVVCSGHIEDIKQLESIKSVTLVLKKPMNIVNEVDKVLNILKDR